MATLTCGLVDCSPSFLAVVRLLGLLRDSQAAGHGMSSDHGVPAAGSSAAQVLLELIRSEPGEKDDRGRRGSAVCGTRAAAAAGEEYDSYSENMHPCYICDGEVFDAQESQSPVSEVVGIREYFQIVETVRE